MIFVQTGLWILILLFVTFVSWRRIHEEYTKENGVVLVIFGALASIVLSKLWSMLLTVVNGVYGWQIWEVATFDMIGGLIGLMLFVYWFHFEKDLLLGGEVIDAMMEGYVWGTVFVWMMMMAMTWRTLGVWDIAFYTFGVVMVWGFYFVKMRYRRFRWYPSGRVGFVGWMSVSVISLIYFISALWNQTGLGMVIKMIVGGLVMAWGINRLYLKSGRKVSKDFGWLPWI